MKKTFLVMVVLVLAAMVVLAKGEAEAPKETGPVTLQVWYAMSGKSGEKIVEITDRFNASHPGVTVEMTYSGKYADANAKISAALLSGTYPDVAITAAGQLYTGGKDDFRTEEYIKDPEFDVGDIFPGMLQYGAFKNRQGALPCGISTQVMYYNADVLKAAGLDMSDPPKTWAEFVAVAKEAQTKGNINNAPEFYGFDTSDNVWLFKSMLAQNGNEVIRIEDGKVVPVFNDPSGVEVAEFWKGMIDSGIMLAGQHSNSEKKFLAGNIAFIAATSNRISRWQGSTGFELGAIPMPCFKKPSVALGGNVAVILAEDKAKADAAWEYVKFILSKEEQTDFAISTGYLPIRKSGLEMPSAQEAMKANKLYKIAFDQLDHAWAYTHFDEMGTMDGDIWMAMDEFEKGVKTPQQALDDAKTALLREME